MQPETIKSSVKEKIGYSPGDSAIALLFLADRLEGAVADPIISGLFRNVFLSVFYKHHQAFR